MAKRQKESEATTMAKKNQPAVTDQDQPINDPTSADQPVSSDVPPADADNTITMAAFMARDDLTSWLSVADAASYLTDVRGATDIDAQKMRNAANNRAEFKAPGAALKVALPGYSIKPLTYLHQSAVDLYHNNNASGNTRQGRVVTNGKRWIVRIKASDLDAVIAALAPFGIELEAASAAHKPKTAEDDASADAPAADAETIAANAEQSADQPHADASSNGAEHTNDAALIDAIDQSFVDMQRTEEFSTSV